MVRVSPKYHIMHKVLINKAACKNPTYLKLYSFKGSARSCLTFWETSNISATSSLVVSIKLDEEMMKKNVQKILEC